MSLLGLVAALATSGLSTTRMGGLLTAVVCALVPLAALSPAGLLAALSLVGPLLLLVLASSSLWLLVLLSVPPGFAAVLEASLLERVGFETVALAATLLGSAASRSPGVPLSLHPLTVPSPLLGLLTLLSLRSLSIPLTVPATLGFLALALPTVVHRSPVAGRTAGLAAVAPLTAVQAVHPAAVVGVPSLLVSPVRLAIPFASITAVARVFTVPVPRSSPVSSVVSVVHGSEVDPCSVANRFALGRCRFELLTSRLPLPGRRSPTSLSCRCRTFQLRANKTRA